MCADVAIDVTVVVMLGRSRDTFVSVEVIVVSVAATTLKPVVKVGYVAEELGGV